MKQIVTAWAEPASGPGLNNSPVWVLVRDSATGELQIESLQPDEQNNDIVLLYAISWATHGKMKQIVEKIYGETPI